MGLEYQKYEFFVLTKIFIVTCEYNLKHFYTLHCIYIFLYKITKKMIFVM